MREATVDVINLDQITSGERYREDFGDLNELSQSIKDRGLIQPLAVKQQSGLRQLEDGYLLLAGGRRFAACKRAEVSRIPVRIYERDLSEYEIRAIELAENYYRKDLNWTEQVKLQREVHMLHQQIHGPRTTVPGEGWSTKDTGDLLGKSRSSVKQDLAIADAYEKAPQLFEKCKSKSDASKVLNSVKASMVQQELQKRAEKKVQSDPKKQNLIDSYIIGDFLDKSENLPKASIDFIEFDPPYGIDLKNSKRTEGPTTVAESYNEIDVNDYMKFIRKSLDQCYKVMSAHSWMILWFGPEPWFENIYQAIILAGIPAVVDTNEWIKSSRGLQTNRMVGIWNKEHGQSKRPEHNLANSYEMFYIIHKGRPALNKPGRSNVFTFKPVPPQQKTHPTERPIELMMELFQTFAASGHRYLIPCLGSGTSLLAGHQCGLTGFGYDLAEDFKKDFTVRVQENL